MAHVLTQECTPDIGLIRFRLTLKNLDRVARIRADILLCWRDASAKLQERPFDEQKEESGCDVNTHFHAEKRRHRGEIDVVVCAELFDGIYDKFLNQVGAVGDAGDKGGPGNHHSTEREPWTHRANKKRSHADGNEWELPDARSDGEIVGFPEIQRVSD